MLILACADRKILSRWKGALEGHENMTEVNHFTLLRRHLRGASRATVLLHRSLPGLKDKGDIINLLKDSPGTGLLVLADVPDEHQGIDLVRSGAHGYANTHIKPEILREAIKVVELGEVWVSKRLLQWMVSHCHEFDRIKSDVGSYLALDTLTPSERHVAEHLSAGNNNKQIARKLNITERTVKAHLTSIYAKTGVKDRLHLVLLVHNNAAA
ncbi:MAG: response regulator transcription factor [Gammaproteobacteria bacterium]|nr:response regulator transcription factor [Gammaproteobacteria bacterium]